MGYGLFYVVTFRLFYQIYVDSFGDMKKNFDPIEDSEQFYIVLQKLCYRLIY